ncbi:MAG TPA: hypothetical protein VHO50_06590 [Bacteroidales bacterium]|nr:hypothetical protein [Bacteroidales bacterium]
MIKSKVYLFFILFVAYVSFSCNKENDVIPDVYVDFYIDINDARYVTKLSSIGGSIIVNQYTTNDPDAAGYAGSGIIIAAGTDNEFYAYDRTCPNEYSIDGSVVQVNIDQTLFAKAVCPECQSAYELLSFGTPASGISKYPLKNYSADFDGRFIHVWNK